MWPPNDGVAVLLLLFGALVLVFGVLIVLGLIERLRNSERWRKAEAEAEERASWIRDLRRDAEAAIRDGGTRTLE